LGITHRHHHGFCHHFSRSILARMSQTQHIQRHILSNTFFSAARRPDDAYVASDRRWLSLAGTPKGRARHGKSRRSVRLASKPYRRAFFPR
jgi:hypothetical protein